MIATLARWRLFYTRGQGWLTLVRDFLLILAAVKVLAWPAWVAGLAAGIGLLGTVLVGWGDVRCGIWQAENEYQAWQVSPPWAWLRNRLDELETRRMQ